MGLIDSSAGGAGLLPTGSLLPSNPLSNPGIIPILPTGSSSSASLPTSSSNSATSSATVTSSPPISSSAPGPTSTSSSTGSSSISTGVSTEADGAVTTVSNIVFETQSSAPTTSAAPSTHESFLQNKALSGSVFGVAGLIVLVLLVILATCVFRRRRRNRLLDDAVSFDPSLLATAEQYDASEKGHSSSGSLGTLGSARPYGATTSQARADAYNPYGARQPQYGGGMPPQQQTYYGAPQQVEYYNDYGSAAQQPYYSNYVPPMTDAPPASLAATTSTARPTHNIPRVPVPLQPLPKEFGSSESEPDRTSVEESEFWAKTLKVTNSDE
ncbi:hypothetical protein C8R45DRAFT_958516 [Mycena sanguinolenta]|nr:hypothetical protein C8R45DRAFT_958516 [Mycena sanguinolenta]